MNGINWHCVLAFIHLLVYLVCITAHDLIKMSVLQPVLFSFYCCLSHLICLDQLIKPKRQTHQTFQSALCSARMHNNKLSNLWTHLLTFFIFNLSLLGTKYFTTLHFLRVCKLRGWMWWLLKLLLELTN